MSRFTPFSFTGCFFISVFFFSSWQAPVNAQSSLSPTEKFDQIFIPPDQFVNDINLYAAAKIAEVAPLLISFSIAGFAIKSFVK